MGLTSAIETKSERRSGQTATDLQPVPATTKIAVSLVSGAVLSLEISLTRFYSILFIHRYTYLVLSIGVFGLAIGGVAVKWLHDRNRGQAKPLQRVYQPVVGSVAVLASTGLLTWGPPFQKVAVAALLALVPFISAGAYQSSVFLQ